MRRRLGGVLAAIVVFPPIKLRASDAMFKWVSGVNKGAFVGMLMGDYGYGKQLHDIRGMNVFRNKTVVPTESGWSYGWSQGAFHAPDDRSSQNYFSLCSGGKGW